MPPFALIELLAGRVARGGVQLSRIYAFDLFAANWDRHPGNYLVLADGGGSQAVFAIDFSHLASHPGLVAAGCDPVTMPLCATRVYFPQVVQPYGADASAAIGIIERLESLPKNAIMSFLTEIPDDWLPQADKSAVLSWWDSPLRIARAAAVKQGLRDGTHI